MRLPQLIQSSLFFFTILTSLSAQYVPDVDWKKLETEHFQVIFPAEIETDAREVAVLAEQVYRLEADDAGALRETRWPLVLTTSSMVSNGYVTLVPQKSVWFGTPAGEGLSALDWYDMLALHETRHMVQMDYLNRNFIRVLYILGGKMGQTAGIHLSVPSWFFEGDSILLETGASAYGRGRDPLFWSRMKVLALNEDFKYQKYLNRSYKDYVPDQYAFGYLMVSYIRNTYGEESWRRILNTTSAFPVPALGFYVAAKRETGKSWSRLFGEMMEDLRSRWEEDAAEPEPERDAHYLLAASPDNYSSYEILFAPEEPEGPVLARKTSLAGRQMLVEITNGQEKAIAPLSMTGGISADRDTAVWAFARPGVRFDAESWSDLVVFDRESRKKRIITRRGRYLYPELSPDGERIAVVYWNTERRAEIHILSLQGEILIHYPLSLKGFPAYPGWSADGDRLFFTLQADEGRAVASLDLVRGNTSLIKRFSTETIKRVTPWEDYLIYASGSGDSENLIAFDPETGDRYRISSSRYGLRYPVIQGNRLYYSMVLPEGNLPVREPLRESAWIREDYDSPEPYGPVFNWDVADLPGPGEEGAPDPGESEDYSLGRGLFNIHSWGIAPNLDTLTGLRFQVEAADVLETASWAAGAEYEINEQQWGAFFELDWKKHYPVFSWNNAAFATGADSYDLDSVLAVSLPLNYRRDIWNFYMAPTVYGGFSATLGESGQDDPYFPLGGGFAGFAYCPGSYRALKPHWGILQRSAAVFDPADVDKYKVYSDSRIYIPGGIRNTGLSGELSLEQQSGHYRLSFPFARGYESSTAFRTMKLAGDYDFPLFYPDLAGGSFFYVKRVRGNLFYDYLKQFGDSRGERVLRSTGAEIDFDLTAANLAQGEFSLGLRFVWLFESAEPLFQLVFVNVAFFQ